MVNIVKIQPGSIAEELDIEAGDKLIQINGQSIKDYIDFQYSTSDESFTILIKKKDGKIWEMEIERAPFEKLGIVLDGIIYDNLKLCKNNCLFCFVKQQASEVRSSLLLKDDDYRFSFLQGSFITLSNLDDQDFQRIIDLKLSPLYISVHTTNPELRVEMMKNKKAAYIKKQLDLLARNGISFHTQIVLCPGFNDGEELDRTIKDLISFYPQILSIGIVPVGLTKFRDDLPVLKSFTNKKAEETLTQIIKWQSYIDNNYGENILYAADEFYYLSSQEIPAYEDYNGFPQIENGIGLSRLLRENFNENKLTMDYSPKSLGIITATLGEKAIKPIVNKIKNIDELDVNIITVENKYFGASVTVTGLLTATDIISRLKEIDKLPKYIFLSTVLINENGFFLDDYTLKDIKDHFPKTNFYIVEDFNEMLEVLKDV